MADDKKNIPAAGKVDELPSQERWRLSKTISRCRISALAKVEISKDKDTPAPPEESAPQLGKDDKRTTIPGMGDPACAGKVADFTAAQDRATKGKAQEKVPAKPRKSRLARTDNASTESKKGAPLCKGAPFLWSNGKPDCGIYVVNF